MISLYIHIPFCVGKCPYCGFYSTPFSRTKADAFLAALRTEASRSRESVKDRTVDTVYIGGGTPTVLAEEQIDVLLDIVRTSFRIAEDAEFTVEANPGTATERKLARWRNGGVNRLSLGVQSFSDEVLQSLGRPHDVKTARVAIVSARAAGFTNLGLDLMYGVPGQTPGQWNDSVSAAIAAGPEHVSLYCLSLDEGSRFAAAAKAGLLVLPDDDRSAEMYEGANASLDGAGYERYELSNFSRPGFACRHNEHYWERGEYLGLGPGAWSFLEGRRFFTIADIDAYCAKMSAGEPAIAGTEAPGPGDAARETLFLALRTMRGLDLGRYEQEYGAAVRGQLDRSATPLRAAGLLVQEQGRLRLTERGILLSNEVVARLLP